MAFTQTDLDAIERALASGELTIRTADRQVTYRTTDELIKARDTVAAALQAQTASARQYPRHQLADFTDD
jgi:hypothetical protein